MRRLSVVGLLVLALASRGRPDQVVLKSGKTIVGKVIAETSDRVIIQVSDTITTQFSKDDVARIVRDALPVPGLTPAGEPDKTDAPARRERQTLCFVQIHGSLESDLVVAAVQRSIEQALLRHPDVMVFEIDTPGGRLDLMQQLAAIIERQDPLETVAYVSGGQHGGAYSAGAVLAIACQKIVMAPGTAIGAAAPVHVGPRGVSAAGEKAVSAITAKVRSLAQKNGHPPELAAAMVDAEVELREATVNGKRTFLSITQAAEEPAAEPQVELGEWITRKGKLLTLTAEEAVRLGVACGLAASRRDVADVLGVEGGTIIDLETDELLQDALDNRAQYLVKLDGQIAAYEARARAVDPAQYKYRRLKRPRGFLEAGDFEDEGRLWRQRSDACVKAIDACLEACRHKLVLGRKHPELKIDPAPVRAKMTELVTLRERVRTERGRRGSEK